MPTTHEFSLTDHLEEDFEREKSNLARDDSSPPSDVKTQIIADHDGSTVDGSFAALLLL